MCPQFVDFDGDNYTDIITATYTGSPFIVRGSAAGWQQPEIICDANGTPLRLAIYWDDQNSRWSNADGSAMKQYQPEGHCVSAAAFDWDDDGDFDLLLGSYGGKLVLHRNEGAAGAPKFSAAHEAVNVAGRPFHLEGGLTAPRLVDWDGDGLTDIVAGGFKGGVYLYRNTGAAGAPEFAAPVTLIAKDGAGGPSSGVYADPVDYDEDGDLDLLVGGYSHSQPEQPNLTEAQRARIGELNAQIAKVQELRATVFAEANKEAEQATTVEERQAIYEKVNSREDMMAANEKWQALQQELGKLQPRATRHAGVWLYRQER